MSDDRPPWKIPDGRHDEKSCPTCGPIMGSAAYKRGVARAKAQTAKATEGMERDDA